MQKRHKRYFWDGTTNLSETYKLRRILEYASFPDLIHYPFKTFKEHIGNINCRKLRTSEKRKFFIQKVITTLNNNVESWEEAIELMIKF